jgi:hypothetical protein
MPQIGPIIAASGRLSILYTERLLADVTPAQFARLAQPGGVELKSNHPAFIFGHLLLYPPRVMAAIGRPAGVTACPETYEPLFKSGAECRDDSSGKIYPPMEELRRRYFESYNAAIAAVAETPDETFVQANPAEGRMKELFPTQGAAVNFYLGGHMQNHLGQFSAWRRAMGLPAA